MRAGFAKTCKQCKALQNHSTTSLRHVIIVLSFHFRHHEKTVTVQHLQRYNYRKTAKGGNPVLVDGKFSLRSQPGRNFEDAARVHEKRKGEEKQLTKKLIGACHAGKGERKPVFPFISTCSLSVVFPFGLWFSLRNHTIDRVAQEFSVTCRWDLNYQRDV